MKFLSLAFLTVLFVSFLPACGEESEKERIPDLSVSDKDVAFYLSEHPGVEPTEARRALEREEKIGRSLLSDPANASKIRWIMHKSAARQALDAEITQRYREDIVDEDILREAYDAFAFDVGSPELVRVSHVLCMVDKNTGAEGEKRAYEAMVSLEGQLRRISESRVLTKEDLGDAARMLALSGFRVAFDQDLTFPRVDVKPFMGKSPSYMRVVEEFEKAAFDLSERDALSSVVRTSFGYHIILYHDRTPSTRPPYDAVRDYLGSEILLHIRRTAVLNLLERLFRQSSVRIDDKYLERLNVE